MSAILLKKNGRTSSLSQTKHIEIRYFFIRDRIERGDIGPEYYRTDEMVAYFTTKPLRGKKFFEFRDRITGTPNGENIAERCEE